MHLLNGCGTPFPSVRHFASSQIVTGAKLLPEHLWHVKFFFGFSFPGQIPRSVIAELENMKASLWRSMALGLSVLVRDAHRAECGHLLLSHLPYTSLPLF